MGPGTARSRTVPCASSFEPRSNVLDGLLEIERATGGSVEVRAARRSGEEHLLKRGLFRRKSTGEVANPAYLEFAFPYYWRYDMPQVPLVLVYGGWSSHHTWDPVAPRLAASFRVHPDLRPPRSQRQRATKRTRADVPVSS